MIANLAGPRYTNESEFREKLYNSFKEKSDQLKAIALIALIATSDKFDKPLYRSNPWSFRDFTCDWQTDENKKQFDKSHANFLINASKIMSDFGENSQKGIYTVLLKIFGDKMSYRDQSAFYTKLNNFISASSWFKDYFDPIFGNEEDREKWAMEYLNGEMSSRGTGRSAMQILKDSGLDEK